MFIKPLLLTLIIYFLHIGVVTALIDNPTTKIHKPNSESIHKAISILIKQKITIATDARVKITLTNIDNYYLPNNCTTPIKTKLVSKNPQKRNATVKISCITNDNHQEWRIYLPVKVEINLPVIIASTTIPMGKIITKHLITKKWVSQHKLKGNEYQIKQKIIGSRAERRIAKNTPLSNSYICFICKNDIVTVMIQKNNLIIKTKAKALVNGVIGEQVKLENLSSNQELNAIVTGVMEAKVLI